MAWRYRDSETGQFVGRATWNRSHAQGGDRYVRESDKYYGEAKAEPQPVKELSNEPQTAEEYEAYYDDYDGDYIDEGEIETGVDY